MIFRRHRVRVWVGILLTLSTRAAFGRLPDWAQTIAESAPTLEEDLPEHQTRVLLSDTHVSVGKDGSLTTRWRYASQALSTRVDRFGVQGFPFREGSRMKTSRAWHLALGDKARRSYLPPVDLVIDTSFLTDVKQRFVGVQGVTRGSLVFFEFEMTEIPKVLAVEHLFFDGAATALDRYEIETPSVGWTLRSDWLRAKGPQATVEGNIWRWEMRDLPVLEDEPLADEPHERAPLLVVSLSPPRGVGLTPLVAEDWPSLGVWLEELFKGRESPTSEISAAAGKLAASGNDFFGKVRRAGLLVRDQVRYVDIEMGIGSLQPRPAGDTFSQLYGDCKDKATLLRALLTANKQISYPVLVNATTKDTVSETVVSFAFNHMVLAVPVVEGSTITPVIASAVVDGGDLGRLLIIDTTNPYAAIGSLPAELAGKKAMVVAGRRSRLVILPPAQAAAHRVDRRILTEVHEDSSLAIESSARFVGEPATRARASYKSEWNDRLRFARS